MKVNKTNQRVFRVVAITLVIVIGLLILGIIFFDKRMSKKEERIITIESPSFINKEANKIQFSNTLKAEKEFFNLIAKARSGQGQLRILHIGDSHVQADFFTGETRKLLSGWLMDNNISRGFTFPYPIIGSNNPDDYIVTWQGCWVRDTNIRNAGLAGLAITTGDRVSELTVKLTPEDNHQVFDRVKIFFESDDKGICPFTKDAMLISKSNNSNTFTFNKPSSEITIGIDWGNSVRCGNLRLFGIELINSQAKVVYNAAGVNGASVTTFLKSHSIFEQIADTNPQIVIISLGTNDAYNPSFCPTQFRDNLRTLVKKILAVMPKAIVVLSTPGDHLVNRETPNPSIELARENIFEVANELNCGVWDFYATMGGAGSIEQWAQNGLCAPDKLHLNRKGYKLKGGLLFDAFVKLAGDKTVLVTTKQPSPNE